jgi:FMN phosphatase YigB (HAD superfamily)
VLFVGDNPERDIKGAKAMGMHTCLAVYGWDLNKNSKVKPEFKIKRIADLPRVLEKLQ